MELGGETRLGMPVELVGRLAERLPAVELVDGSSVILGARLRKSDAEIERLARACAANTHAFGAVFTGSLEGVAEDVVARRLVRSALDAADDWADHDGSVGRDGSGGWTMPGWVAITSGEGGYDRFLGHPRPRTLEVGDMVWADLGVTVDGYWSDFCRAAVVGGPTTRQRDQQDRILAATADGVAVARPGMRARDVAAAVTRGLERVGLPSFGFGRVGHGIGLTATEIPHIAAYDSTVLERGMVVTVEPASVGTDGLYCAEQVVVVDDPPRVLSLASGELGSV
jgi:Xaa-Pro aminopeptidase